MKTIVDFLQKSGIQYLATIGLDGKPKVRPFQFTFEDGGKLWFCTANTKEVYRELKETPYIELCASGEKMSWLRLEAKVIFTDDKAIKERILEESQLIRGIYKTADNPAFELFYLADGTASISTIGQAPHITKF